MIDLDRINRLKTNTEWLHPGDDNYFHHLRCEIENLRRPGDVFTVPSPHGPYAWRAAWTILEKLRAREAMPPNPAVVANAVREQNTQKVWNEYLNARTKILEYVRRGEIDEDAAQFIGLRPGDLGSPTSTDPEAARRGSKRADWWDVADRVSYAVSQWENLSREEKHTIPIVMAARRADAATARLEQRVAEFEAGRATQ
jgi:hypothetical protein